MEGPSTRAEEGSLAETMTAWRQCYRLLCKQAPCLPEIACRFAKVPMMRRSFEICRLFPCAQGPALDFDQNASTRSYREYLQRYVTDGTQILVVQQNFLAYARGKSKGRGRGKGLAEEVEVLAAEHKKAGVIRARGGVVERRVV